MNRINCLPLKLLFGILLALAPITDMAQGQVVRPRPEISLYGTPHHVIGRVEKGKCPIPLNGLTLQISEFWYTLTGNGDKNLILPSHPNNETLDPLRFTGRILEQGRVLGQMTLTADTSNFDIQWLEVPLSNRVPWVQNVQNGRTGDLVTVYRVLKLQVNAGVNSGFYSKVNSPVPLIMFFGTETIKNVGNVNVDCFRTN